MSTIPAMLGYYCGANPVYSTSNTRNAFGARRSTGGYSILQVVATSPDWYKAGGSGEDLLWPRPLSCIPATHQPRTTQRNPLPTQPFDPKTTFFAHRNPQPENRKDEL